jgi:exonuclease SbcC
VKPLRLKMSAFGSYAGETEIDFQKINQGVFLITGDTGSGKTTIFDGIMYALYGQTSGGRRDGPMMRSQYAELATKTFVELEFEVRKKRYRVIRNPEYERESKRRNKDGERTITKEKAGAELYLSDGTLFLGNRQETNRKISEIIGVDAKQFSQIAMIAQGDFMKLLLAKSDERKEIFARIFDTHIYWRVQEELKRQAKSIYIELEDNRKSCLREIEQMEGRREEDAARRSELLLTGEKEPDIEQALVLVTQILEDDQQEYTKNQENEKKCSQQLEKKTQEYSLAKERMQYFLNLERINESWEKLEADKKSWEEKQEILQQGKKSVPVAAQENAFQKEKVDLERTKERLLELAKWMNEHQARAGEAKTKLEQVQAYHTKLQEKEIPVLHRLKEALAQYEKLQLLIDEADKLEKQKTLDKKQYEKSQSDYLKLAGEYEELYQSYFHEQAGILAVGLKEGTPCPVCGSLTHPCIAPLSKKAPTKEQVEKKKAARDRAEKQRETAQDKLLSSTTKLDSRMSVIRETQLRLLGEEEPEVSLEKIRARWEDWEKKARERVSKGDMQVADAEKHLSLCTQDYQKLLQEESVRKGQLEENQKLEKEQQESVLRERERYTAILSDQGFSDEEEYKKYKTDAKTLERMENEIQTYQKQKIELAQQKKLLEEQLKGKEKPDLLVIEEAVREMKERQKTLETAMRKVYSRREKNRAVLKKMKELGKDRIQIRARYEKVGNLSRTANGNLSGSVKMDFESYMQRQYFEQMIACANHHLQKIASGQFLLRCRSLEHLSTQGNAGLDLDVYSLVTGKERDVKTLSGGESFMASLSLALGMTDVITRTTGAVRIDTLFIDEGFGSLDDNSREQAIRILQGLSGGQRMVGIISHVTELKDEIEQKLVVTKSKRGSQAAWK